MAASHPSVSPPIAERTKHPFVTYDMIHEIPDALQRTIESTSGQLGSIAGHLEDRSSFYYTGCGTAFFSAMLGSDILSVGREELRFRCVQALELSNHSQLAEKNATFGVSHSGITKTTLDALRRAKSRDGYTVGITHFGQSPINQVADQIVVVGNGPDKSRCHTKCYLTGALALTEIGIDLLDQRQAAQPKRLQRLREELLRLPQLTKNVLDSTESVMSDLAEKNAGKGTFYFAGTNGSYPNALEAALKIMETSYIPAQGFETEQILHGPWVSPDGESVLFVIATEERAIERSLDLVKAATSLGSTVVAIVKEGEREISQVGMNVIGLPEVDNQLYPFLSVIPLYLFAYYMSVRRGYNPDYLRYLTPAYWNARTIIFPPGTH